MNITFIYVHKNNEFKKKQIKKRASKKTIS